MGAKKLAKKAPKAETTTPMEPTSAVADMVTKNRQSLAMLTASIAVASAASEWNIAKQYETNIWNPLFTMTLNFLITVILALAVGLSPTGKSLRPGAPPTKKPKNSVIGGGMIFVAVWAGFGWFGPCGVVTALAAFATIVLGL